MSALSHLHGDVRNVIATEVWSSEGRCELGLQMEVVHLDEMWAMQWKREPWERACAQMTLRCRSPLQEEQPGKGRKKSQVKISVFPKRRDSPSTLAGKVLIFESRPLLKTVDIVQFC